jgi:SAM-dependent methyltransferase
MARPAFRVPNLVPTLNGTGFQFEIRDEYADAWIAQAAGCADPVLEIGCAYGVAALPALAAGARVVACDMEPRHLAILAENVARDARVRLHCVAGRLPDLEFAPAQFAAILCSRVLHFLDGEEIDSALMRMASWLKPGGRLYLVADTPYGIWRRFIPEFEHKRRQQQRWPGLMRGLHRYLPTPGIHRHINSPAFMNLFDDALLERSCREAGLQVERVGFIARPDFRGQARMDGRENVGVIAVRTA